PAQPQVGATADWWTIECLDDDRLVLGSTAWFFGDAWLGYRVTGPQGPPSKIGTSGPARIKQVAAFRPRGAPGLAYWRFLRPVHGRVFEVMARQRVAHLHALDASLRRRGGRLLVRHGRPSEVVAQVTAEAGAGAVHANADATPYGRPRRPSRTRTT
ncbi:MAG TPA: DUF2867 domain-containing protein, partial [Acidimicrobiales bacterium]|nr:DUF2867 domain-containing protein [Acidimicrobiales bacterium]